MTKTLLLGLDGLSWEMVEKMNNRGSMPNISSLAESSPTGITKSTIPTMTCPALPSLYTGQNPGNLGIFDFVKPDGTITNLTDVDAPKLWDYLDAEGKRSFVAGMRTTHPAPKINGVFISGILDPEDEPHYVTPMSYQEEADRFQNASVNLQPLIDADDRAGIADRLVNSIETKTDVYLEVLNLEQPTLDFGLLWLSASDSAQHHLWGHNEELAQFFEAFDENVGRLLSFANRHGYEVLVVSDHGFGPAIKHYFHMNEWLYRRGYLSVVGGRLGKPFVNLGHRIAEEYITDSLKRRLLSTIDNIPGLRGKDSSDGDKVDGSKPEDDGTVITPLNNIPGVDWSKTVAHLSTRKGWGISIREDKLNRDPELVRQELIRELQEIEHPDGGPLFKNVWPGEEVYFGRYADQIPDVIVLCRNDVRSRPSLTGSLFSEAKRVWRSIGDHTTAREGILLATGPNIREDSVDVGEIEIYDVLPTVLHMVGAPIPHCVDGDVVSDLFAGGSELADRQIKYEDFNETTDDVAGEYGQGEGVKQRLRDLGYMN